MYLFDNYVLDTDQRELRRDHDTIALQPQVFDLLEYLIRKRDRVVTKDDLIAAIWGGRISESALTTRINAARTAIGDSGDEQRLIKTFPRKGIRFVGSVREEGRSASETTLTVAQPVPRLSIVVLPFANFSGDPGQDYFADGITESLTTDLSRISGSFVIARNTAFTFKGNAVGAQKLGQELNVRYVLEGSVQRRGNRLRVNAQLIDAETGSHLWAGASTNRSPISSTCRTKSFPASPIHSMPSSLRRRRGARRVQIIRMQWTCTSRAPAAGTRG